MLYLGIDQHRKQLTVNVRDEQGDVVLKRQVSTQWDRVRKFFEELRGLAEPEGGFLAIVEICGFNDWLLQMLKEYECREGVLIQPEKRSRKKTDRRDASALSQLLWVNRQRVLGGKRVQGLKRIILPSQDEQDNRQLTALRQRTAALRTRTINKVQHILLKHNLQQECPTKGMKTKRARQWLTELPLGKVDRLEMDHLLAQWELWDAQIAKIDAQKRSPGRGKGPGRTQQCAIAPQHDHQSRILQRHLCALHHGSRIRVTASHVIEHRLEVALAQPDNQFGQKVIKLFPLRFTEYCYACHWPKCTG